MVSSNALVTILEVELEQAMENLRFEDETRSLFSLSKSKNASVKLPMFTGRRISRGSRS